MSDRISKVPHQIYPTDLAGQIEALKIDPILERFRKSREELSRDPLRPIYHFTSPESKLNDPNGLSFWKGRWHLFYQAFPPEDPRLHWGHAVSPDLAHWKDLPYAIYPDPESNCFSGSALVEEDRVLAMYHGTECGNMVAEASDPLLLNWSKIAGDAVIKRPPNGPYSVYDPCIWKQGNYYYSLSGELLPHPVSGRRSRAEFLFRSADLTHWEYLHPFYDSLEFSEADDDGACPYFWPLGDRWILFHFSHCFGAKWILGDYDTERQKFLPCAGGKFNTGGWYPGGVGAPSACPLPDGSVACICHLSLGKDTKGGDQVMALPRKISLTGPCRDEIRNEPLGDFDSLHGESVEIGEMVLPANEEVILPIHGKAMELRLTLEAGNTLLELNVFRSPDAKEVTRIRFYPLNGGMDWTRLKMIMDAGGGYDWVHSQRSVLSVESAESTLDPEVSIRAPQTCSWYHPGNTPLELRIFLDNSILEVFADNREAVSMRVYPSRADSDGISLVSRGKDGKLLKLQAWQMKSAFEEEIVFEGAPT